MYFEKVKSGVSAICTVSNQFTGLNNSICAPKTIYIRTMSGIRSNNVRENGAPDGIQAILEAGQCRSFSDVGGQSVQRSARTNGRGF